MFNYKLNYVLLIAFVSIQLLACKKHHDDARVSCSNIPEPEDTYAYPIKPGTPQWDALVSGEEKLNSCQIPENTLHSMSTEGLIQSWLNFPLANEILAANSLQKGTEFFIDNFSGLQELCKRNDAGLKLYERYKQMSTACISSLTTDIDRGAYTFSFTYIEMLLGQDTILNKLAASEKKLVVSEAVNKYNDKNKYLVYFGSFGTATSVFVCGKSMQNDLYQPFLTEIQNSLILEKFLNTCSLPADKQQATELVTSILNHSLNFIK
ncbi:MAG: hypothetical protein QM763_24830 [Agriterribacter sp.]